MRHNIQEIIFDTIYNRKSQFLLIRIWKYGL